jgi:Lipase (class 3)
MRKHLTCLSRSIPPNNKRNKVGHSLGGALAELDALYFTLNLPVGTSIKAMTYGTPRVGNIAFAQLIDSKARYNLRFFWYILTLNPKVPDFTRINNEKGQQFLRKDMKMESKSDILQTSSLSSLDDSWGFRTLTVRFILYRRGTLLRVLVS